MRIAVENHITVPFTEDMDQGGHEEERWTEGVDTLAQIKRLLTDLDTPWIGVCVAPAHLWVVNETISEVITYLAERKKLFHYYVWDIGRSYRRGVDGLNFGPGEEPLPRPDGTLDHGGAAADAGERGLRGRRKPEVPRDGGLADRRRSRPSLVPRRRTSGSSLPTGVAMTEPLRWGAVGASWIARGLGHPGDPRDRR